MQRGSFLHFRCVWGGLLEIVDFPVTLYMDVLNYALKVILMLPHTISWDNNK